MDHVSESQVLPCSEVLICDNSDMSVASTTTTTSTTTSKPTTAAATTTPTSTIAANAITTDFKCTTEYVNQSPDYLGSTVERMPATPTPPSSPPGKRKPQTLISEMPLTDIVAKNVVADSDTSTSSSCTDNVAPVQSVPANGAIHFREQHYLNLTGHNAPSLPLTPSPQTPSMSSTNASTTPSSALHTSVSLASISSNNNSNNNSCSTSNSSSSLAASTTAAQSVVRTTHKHGLTPEQLLKWQDMPHYLQFNPYVLRGYRPLQTFQGCLLSLFYWHNETINILTHALPIIYILAIVPGLMPWDKGYKFLSFCHLFGSVAPWCGSFVYHLFMNIEQGESVYYTLLKLDMIGIWVSQSFGALPLVTATTFCFTPILKWFIISAYCLLSLWGLYKALTATSPWQRRLCFGLPFAMRSVLTFLRIRGFVGGSHMALSHVFLQDGVSILGGAIGAMRIPEKWFPGLVDFYLNSHNIMHVLVVVAVYSMHKATIKDFEWMSTQTCNSYGNYTVEPLAEPAFESHSEL